MHKFRAPGDSSDRILAVAPNWVLSKELTFIHPSGAQNILYWVPRFFKNIFAHLVYEITLTLILLMWRI
jgi:hypothetical protein